MKQTIRRETFETNSSSYHTLSIQKVQDKPIPREIIKGQDLIINNHIEYKTIGYTESYSYTARGSYEKAQLVLRFMGYELLEQFDNLGYDEQYRDERGYRDWDKYPEIFKEHFYEIPLIQSFVKAIKKYVGEDKNVVIEFNDDSNPYIETVSDEGKGTAAVFNVDKDDLKDIDKMSEVFYNIIFNNDYEMTEECESNE